MQEEKLQLNFKQEKFVVRLTEWEKDCILQCIETGTFPGILVPLAHGLIEKIKSAKEEVAVDLCENPGNKDGVEAP